MTSGEKIEERGSPTNYSRSRQVAESRQKSGPLTPPVHNFGHNLGHKSTIVLLLCPSILPRCSQRVRRDNLLHLVQNHLLVGRKGLGSFHDKAG